MLKSLIVRVCLHDMFTRHVYTIKAKKQKKVWFKPYLINTGHTTTNHLYLRLGYF